MPAPKRRTISLNIGGNGRRKRRKNNQTFHAEQSTRALFEALFFWQNNILNTFLGPFFYHFLKGPFFAEDNLKKKKKKKLKSEDIEKQFHQILKDTVYNAELFKRKANIDRLQVEAAVENIIQHHSISPLCISELKVFLTALQSTHPVAFAFIKTNFWEWEPEMGSYDVRT